MPRKNGVIAFTCYARRLAIGLGATALLMPLSSAALVGKAQAAVGPCRSDPIVTLTNLKTLDLSATISDTRDDLRSVSYTMHLPQGVKPLLVIPTDGLVGQVEHFNYVNDQPSGSYVVTTEAFTGATVSVTATAIGVLIGSGRGTGVSNAPINVKL